MENISIHFNKGVALLIHAPAVNPLYHRRQDSRLPNRLESLASRWKIARHKNREFKNRRLRNARVAEREARDEKSGKAKKKKILSRELLFLRSFSKQLNLESRKSYK